MESTKKRQNLLLLLTLLTLCFIWGNSLMPASVSGAFSGWVQDLLSRLFGGMIQPDTGDGILRKFAHGTEYLILGLELTLLLRRLQHRPLSLLFLSGVSVALIDETIQLFVAGRCGQIKDVWIDLGGFVTGFLMFLLWNALRTKHTT